MWQNTERTSKTRGIGSVVLFDISSELCNRTSDKNRSNTNSKRFGDVCNCSLIRFYKPTPVCTRLNQLPAQCSRVSQQSAPLCLKSSVKRTNSYGNVLSHLSNCFLILQTFGQASVKFHSGTV